MSEEEKIIEFVRDFVQKRGAIPSIRRICRECDVSPPWLYRRFGSLESLCEKVGVKVDREMRSRLKRSKKTTKHRVKKAMKKMAPKEQAPPTIESDMPEPSPAPTFETIQQNLKDEESARQERLENVEKFATQIQVLVMDENPEISNIAMDALAGVLPTILEHKFGVKAPLKDLLEAPRTLAEIRKEREKLRKKEIQLSGISEKVRAERVDLQLEWEKVKNIHEKGVLLQRIEQLERENKVCVRQLNEAREVFIECDRVIQVSCIKRKTCNEHVCIYLFFCFEIISDNAHSITQI